MTDHEKLGVFYLGREVDPARGSAGRGLVLLDSRDLLTHAVIVGMTGSGKTGLGIGLLEEAAIDGIPALVIDPKGDLANLLLTFPDLRPEDFRPWVSEDAARRAGLGLDEQARAECERWRKGLAEWDQDGERIRRLRAAADIQVYTPGAESGSPVSILRSFAAPAPALRQDHDLLRERASSTVTGLLGLLGIDADPVKSREHILLATLLVTAWREGRDLDLARLIQAIQTPSFARVGVLDLETFYPSSARFTLAMALNNLLAAPGFEAWLKGAPLDPAHLLYTAEGRPRLAVLSIAHLAEPERMLFVSLLLNETVAWMRAQPGTQSLRALVYMDEVMGYFPPVANPPSKAPLLTLMKQARAFGVGVVLATQNPVDIDYKGLGNAGTWFIGRLQTERDKARLLDGLEGVRGGALDRAHADRLIAGLAKRVFYLHSVHEERPRLFQTRWTMSYLAGPLTREQLRAVSAAPPAAAAAAAIEAPSEAPVLPPDLPQAYLPIRAARPAGATLLYQPMLYGSAAVSFRDAAAAGHERIVSLLAPLAPGSGVAWSEAEAIDLAGDALERAPGPGARFAPVPPEAARTRSYEKWRRELVDQVHRSAALTLLRSPALGAVSQPGEAERDFRIRLRDLAHEHRDARKDALARRFAPQLERLRERIRRAEEKQQLESEQARQHKLQSAISIGATVLGALFGRKAMSASTLGRATTAARGVGRAAKESADVARAGETIEALQARLAELDAELAAALAGAEAASDPLAGKLETEVLRPRKGDVVVRALALAWAPEWRDARGGASPAWR